jgi:hypothetical protein
LKSDRNKLLQRADIVGRKVTKILVSDDGRQGEFDLTNVWVQIEGGAWFSLHMGGVDFETPIQCLDEPRIAAAKQIAWKESETCIGKTIQEVVINSWPTIGLLLDNGTILCCEFFSTALRPNLVPLLEFSSSDLKTYWGHTPIAVRID